MSYLIPKKRKIYGNYKVFSPDGKLMFRCDEKKANWYLSRDLAHLKNKKKIYLNFQPNGLGNYDKSYGLGEMSNKCVVCGTQEFLTRHHVVPISYRRYFPVEIKSHNFHDVLPLCKDCHEGYERKADILKKNIEVQYNAPINNNSLSVKNTIKSKKMANSLIKYKNVMAIERFNSMRNKLKDILGVKKLNNRKIVEVANLHIDIKTKTHGQIVVENVNINEFIILWRKHFIDNNDCKFLPKNWSINFK